MSHQLPASPAARRAIDLVETLQRRLVTHLEALSVESGVSEPFVQTHWLRDDGRHGGGQRLGTTQNAAFHQASANVSCVFYDDEPSRQISSATALSSIVHPYNPNAPSMHLHVSWTEPRSEPGTWRIMADLNPSTPYDADTDVWSNALTAAAPELYPAAAAQGARYFFIPALGRTRGISHFYLEGYRTGDADADERLARTVIETAIDTYAAIVRRRLLLPASESDFQRQLAYHTLYLFQVLTLDRGTTSGLLVHDQNDLGIMGSLPPRIDVALLASWRDRLPELQQGLLDALVAATPHGIVDAPARKALATVVRDHYRKHPAALALQAEAGIVGAS